MENGDFFSRYISYIYISNGCTYKSMYIFWNNNKIFHILLSYEMEKNVLLIIDNSITLKRIVAQLYKW